MKEGLVEITTFKTTGKGIINVSPNHLKNTHYNLIESIFGDSTKLFFTRTTESSHETLVSLSLNSHQDFSHFPMKQNDFSLLNDSLVIIKNNYFLERIESVTRMNTLDYSALRVILTKYMLNNKIGKIHSISSRATTDFELRTMGLVGFTEIGKLTDTTLALLELRAG